MAQPLVSAWALANELDGGLRREVGAEGGVGRALEQGVKIGGREHAEGDGRHRVSCFFCAIQLVRLKGKYSLRGVTKNITQLAVSAKTVGYASAGSDRLRHIVSVILGGSVS